MRHGLYSFMATSRDPFVKCRQCVESCELLSREIVHLLIGTYTHVYVHVHTYVHVVESPNKEHFGTVILSFVRRLSLIGKFKMY